MEQERRKEGRKVLPRPHRGELFLSHGGSEQPVEAVVNVSPLGIGVRVREAVQVDRPVAVHYRSDVVEMELLGIVVWMTPAQEADPKADSEAFAVGVELISPTLLHNLL